MVAFAILWFSLSSSLAVTFNVNMTWLKALSKDAIHENMMTVHFADNGNNFWGFFYFSNGSGEDVEWNYEVEASNTNFVCGKQIRWFYYNAERWERLWPLDDQTWQNIPWIRGLDTTWWIYTMCGNPGYDDALKGCEKGKYSGCTNCAYNDCVNAVNQHFHADWFGYYGSLNHEYSWHHFNLTMWVNYKYPGNNEFISIKQNSTLSPTFVRINNKYPVGFIYDYNGWLGLVWCKFSSVSDDSMRNLLGEVEVKNGLSNVFQVNSAWTGIIVTGDASGYVTCEDADMTTEDTLVKILIEGIVWLDDTWIWTKYWWLGNSTDTKMQYFGTKSVSNAGLMNYVAKKAESLCRWKWTEKGNSNGKIICLDTSKTLGLYNSDENTFIIKKWDVVIKPNDENDTKYDIYLLSGNLIIDESNATGYLIWTNGFIKSDNTSTWNECVSGSVANGDFNIYCTGAAVASVLRWNFVVNGNVVWTWGSTEGKLDHKYFIYGKFMTKDSISDLENVFSWRCDNWIGSDGYYCPKFEGNPYRNAALVVIDQNYNSPLLNS